MKIKIIYEDKDVVVIDKPSGISVHSDGKTKEKTISDWFIKKYPKSKNVGESIFFEGKEIKKPGIVHRLDRETSGVLILVKNEKTYDFLKEQFQNRKIKKTYIAIIEGWPKNDQGIINKPIGRSPTDFRRRLAGRGARGELREAITEYKVLKRFKTMAWQNPLEGRCLGVLAERSLSARRPARVPPKEFAMPFSLLEIYPKTGRTHQIRVHLKFLNYPIVCDSLYNPKGFYLKEIGRLALHAKSIEFKNLKGKNIKVESPIPKEFTKILE
jgi:23S rRNA pseudouridine1911/1915/1917 synthase